MRQKTLGAAATAMFVVAGCPSAEPETGPPEPVDVWFGEAVEGVSEVLLEGPVQFAAALPDWRTIAQVDGELLEWGPLDAGPRSLGTEIGRVRAVEPMPDGVLIAADTGLYTLTDWGLVESPLGASWTPTGDAQLVSVRRSDAADLWLADDAGLSLWRDGELFSISAGELPTASATLAWGSPVQDFGALWIAAEDVVYALVQQGDGFVTWEEGGSQAPVALAVDGVDDLWTILSGAGDPDWGWAGDMRRRLPDGTWQWFRLPAQPRVLATGPSAHVWVRSNEDAPRLWHQLLDTWSDVVVDGASPLRVDDTLAGTDEAGRLLVHGPEGLRRISIDRPVMFVGLEDGGALDSVTTVTAVPTLAREAATMAATLDGAPVELTEVNIGDGLAWAMTLDPVELEDGAHELHVTATWDEDAEPVEQSLFFSVGAFAPPTWGADIEPLNELFCTRCHAADGGAHLLDTRARWEDEVDLILENVIMGTMPISGDKLSADQIRSIELWRAGGFLE